MPTHEARNDSLILALNDEPSGLQVTLTDRLAGRVWGPVPLLRFEAYSKAEFRTVWVDRYRVDQVEELGDGFHVSIGDPQRQLRVGLWLRLAGNELVIRMQLSEVYEDKEYAYRLMAVAPLPGLIRVSGLESKLLLPLNSGMLCDPAGKEAVRDRFMIYGEQTRWELVPMIPICAGIDAASGLVALASQGAEETECLVATDGQGAGDVGLGFVLRQFWPDPVEKATREIRIGTLPAGADIVVATAKRLRHHVIDDHRKPTLIERAAESPEMASLLDSYIMKLFYAVENKGIMMAGHRKGDPITFNRVMSFAEAGEGLRRIKEAGIAKVHTQSVGFNPSGHDGMWPSRFPIEERLGGEEGFRRLIELGKSLGFTMNVHDNQKASYRRSLDWREEWVIHDQWGIPMALGEWGGGPTYVLNQYARGEAVIGREMRAMQDLGLNGPAYLDGMANPLYRDYHPDHRLTRTGFAQMTNLLVKVAQEVWGAAATECGFLYCAIEADCMCTCGDEWHMQGCHADWPVTKLMDRRVPVWQLAIHDLIVLEQQGLSWEVLMRAVLMGGHPRDEWSAHPGVMPVLTDERIAKQKAMYDVAIKQFGNLRTTEMLTWSEPAAEVEKTTWADGTEVVADFGKQELLVNGQPVSRPAALS